MHFSLHIEHMGTSWKSQSKKQAYEKYGTPVLLQSWNNRRQMMINLICIPLEENIQDLNHRHKMMNNMVLHVQKKKRLKFEEKV